MEGEGTTKSTAAAVTSTIITATITKTADSPDTVEQSSPGLGVLLFALLRRMSANGQPALATVCDGVTRMTGMNRQQLLFCLVALVLFCTLLGPLPQLLFIALALIHPIQASVSALRDIPVGQQHLSSSQQLALHSRREQLLVYWTLFGLQSLLLDFLLAPLLSAVLLLWPLKIAFLALVFFTRQGDPVVVKQLLFEPFGAFLEANLTKWIQSGEPQKREPARN